VLWEKSRSRFFSYQAIDETLGTDFSITVFPSKEQDVARLFSNERNINIELIVTEMILFHGLDFFSAEKLRQVFAILLRLQA